MRRWPGREDIDRARDRLARESMLVALGGILLAACAFAVVAWLMLACGAP